IPAFTMSSNLPDSTLYPVPSGFSLRCSTINHPSWPALTASIRAGSTSALATNCTPVRSSPSASILVTALATFTSTLPPPGTIPSSTAERVARSASSVRVLRYLSSASLGAPTLITATRSEEHTSELQSRLHLVCRLLLEKKKKKMARSNSVTSLTVRIKHARDEWTC